ncbi:MAG: DUF2147 domain-containing protein [Bacteroidaceae bacterium]|nr:DUF2147 domain-containing protein [Bacteroidaceae bacterium]
MIKKFFVMLVCGLMAAAGVSAQVKADDILGTYRVVQGKDNSKVTFRKSGNGYSCQVVWLENMKEKDGTLRTDKKNPDKAKRSTPSDKIVLIEKVTFDEAKQEWGNGQIYDPTRGKFFKVRISFKDAKTLKVRGSWGPISETVEWTKL